jgi:hypothetical protein
LQEVGRETNGDAYTKRDVWEAGDTFVPASLFSEKVIGITERKRKVTNQAKAIHKKPKAKTTGSVANI